MSVELEALRQCCSNYEVAIRAVQAQVELSEKETARVEKQLQKLIKVVTHNAKNSATILKQAGIEQE